MILSKKTVLTVMVLVLVTLVILVSYLSQGLKRKYKNEALAAINESGFKSLEILKEEDLKSLPKAVQDYIRFSGAVGKEKVRNFKVIAEGEFKTSPDRGWSECSISQHNFLKNPKRLYYMQLKMFGIPVMGLHEYINHEASMKIKIGGLLTVAGAHGEIMNKAETVTVFNDMCIFAPGALIDDRIKWDTTDDPLKVKAAFVSGSIKISADLYFDGGGKLVNFVSHDRYMTTTGDKYEQYTWSTPIGEYKEFNGFKLSSYGEAVWSMPNGDYCYGKMNIKDVVYNVSE